MNKRSLLVFALSFLVLLIDQVTKILVKTTMYINQEFQLFGSWFNIHFVENEGMAMGISWGGELGKYSLTLFRIVAIIVLIVYIHSLIKKKASMALLATMALILAGAMGNVFDSLFYGLVFSDSYGQVASLVPWGTGYRSFMQGHVVDMISIQLFRIPSWFPLYGGQKFFPFIFNVADAAISVGIVLLVIFQKNFFIEEPSSSEEQVAEN
ncbi:MAG: lipoprotein signal peptidase [Chitinophagales bacterium]